MTPSAITKSRNQTAADLKVLVNAVFASKGPRPGMLIFGPRPTLEEAAQVWLACEVESYLTLLTKQTVTAIKVWKNFPVDGMHDVYLTIRAEGRGQPEFGLKVYVTVSNDTCQFTLEDWSINFSGFVNGKVEESGGGYKFSGIPHPATAPGTYEYRWQDAEIPT